MKKATGRKCQPDGQISAPVGGSDLVSPGRIFQVQKKKRQSVDEGTED